jgi:signal transduction histidine kinase
MTRLTILFILAVALLGASVYWQNNPQFPSRQSIVEKIESNLSREINSFRLELNRLASSPDSATVWSQVHHSFFLYDSTGVVRWNTSRYFPDPRNFDNDSIEYYKNGSSHYLVAQRVLSEKKGIVGFITLQEGFSIQNQYLRVRLNPGVFPGSNVEFESASFPSDIHFEDRKLFSVSIGLDALDDEPVNIKAWLAFVISLLILMWITGLLIRKLEMMNRRWVAVIVVFLLLLGLRFIMVYGNFPYPSREIPIFNPREFASSTFNNSIGNLLFNTFSLFLVSVLTFYFYRKPSFSFWSDKSEYLKFIAGAIFFLLFFGSQLLPFLYLETLYHNSIITPDISQQLSFDLVRLCAVACIVLSSFTGVLFSISFFKLSTRVYVRRERAYIYSALFAALVFLLYHYATDRNYEIPLILTLVNITVLIFGSLNRGLKIRLAGNSTLILLQLIIYSSQAALAIRWLSVEREHEAMLKFGNTFLIERDVFGEYLLSQAILRIEQDVFIQQQMVNPFNRLSTIEQKVRRTHLHPYFDRYDSKIYLSDNRGVIEGSSQSMNLPSLIQEFSPLAENTDYKGIYIIRNPDNRLIKRYLAVIPIKYHVAGFVVIDMRLRQVLPSAVFPKLLLESRFSAYAASSNYSYAVFENGNLVSASGPFIYQGDAIHRTLGDPTRSDKSVQLNGYDHITLYRDEGQVAIISSRSYTLLNLIANFSFYFLIGISLVALSWLISYLSISGIPNLTYSNRIRLYVYLAVVLPLAALAITILRVNFYAEGKRSEEISVKQARNLAASLAPFFNGSAESIEEELSRQSLGAGVDVTVYSTKGVVLASSQPDIYSNQILSRYMNPRALSLLSASVRSFTIDESIGNLKFKNTYSAVISPASNEILGIVSIPFFASQESFEKDQIQLVSNILVVFVVVFILFYLLSYIALDWLTRPLKVMSNVLQQTTLSGTNKKLVWNSKDEIGAMVTEYNNMIDNLTRSKNELERRQREAAWREMARQVAHEIKNPLTPIKLTLQQIERSIDSGQSDKENTSARIKTVLHQVDILNEIASSFSAFAQMPEPKLERLDLINMIREVVSLYKTDVKRLITFDHHGNSVWVMADRQLFSRILSNIILNSIQSEKENEPIRVNVGVKLEGAFITLSIVDNGKGIPTEMRDRIFIPYFSTKESGSGLGLAIAKQGVEQSGGRIWCESELEKGTTFFISLPLAK